MVVQRQRKMNFRRPRNALPPATCWGSSLLPLTKNVPLPGRPRSASVADVRSSETTRDGHTGCADPGHLNAVDRSAEPQPKSPRRYPHFHTKCANQCIYRAGSRERYASKTASYARATGPPCQRVVCLRFHEAAQHRQVHAGPLNAIHNALIVNSAEKIAKNPHTSSNPFSATLQCSSSCSRRAPRLDFNVRILTLKSAVVAGDGVA